MEADAQVTHTRIVLTEKVQYTVLIACSVILSKVTPSKASRSDEVSVF